LGAARGHRNAEIKHPWDPFDAHEDVLRTHVSMHEAERLSVLVGRFMGGMEPVQRAAKYG